MLAAAMSSRTLTAGAPLLSAGQPNDALFFLVRGELLVSLPFESGAMFVGTRAPGSWVGEVSLLEPGPATATVSAAQDSELLVLSSGALAALTESHPELVGRLVRALSEDLAHRVRSAAVVLEAAPPKAPPGFFRGLFGKLFGDRSAS